MAIAIKEVLLTENFLYFLQLPLQKNSSVGYGCVALDEARPTFGGNLRNLMNRSGVRVTDVAAELGVVKSAVSGWLHDKVELPNTPTLLRLAKAVRCSVDEMLAGLDPDYDKVIRDLNRQIKDQGSPPERGSDVPASVRVEASRVESASKKLQVAAEEIAARLMDIAGELSATAQAGATQPAEPGTRSRRRKSG